jgi:hypothetical protein
LRAAWSFVPLIAFSACATALDVEIDVEWSPEARLIATVVGADVEDVAFAWFVDGVLEPELTGPIVERRYLDYGQSWSVLVEPRNGGRGARAKLELAAAPSLTPVLSPETPDTRDDIVARIIETDGFLQDPVFSVRWWQGSTERLDLKDLLTVPASETTKGERWTVEIQAIDPWSGEARRATTDIVNAAPEIPVFSITPATLTTNASATARVTPVDADGDTLDIRYVWTVDGAVVQDGPWHWLRGDTYFARDQEVVVEVIASDGEAETRSTVGATVANTAPGTPTVAMEPAVPVAGAPLACVVTAAAPDPDGDTATYTVAWDVDGTPYTAVSADGAVPEGVVDTGQTWTCTVTASDDVATGGTATATGTAGFRYATVAVGGAHACGLRRTGALYCAGDDTWGQSTPPAGLNDVQQLAAGLDHTCALDGAGAVSCWGSNTSHQIEAPVEDGFVAITAGSWHTCALDAAGEATCWGLDVGQLEAPAGLSFTDLSAGAFHTCGRLTDGTLACWGTNPFGTSPPAGDTWDQVTSGGWHNCALDERGQAVCWGWGDAGQTQAPGNTFLTLAANDEQSCGIGTAGAITCWGASSPSQQPPGGAYDVIDGAGALMCAITTSGGVRCWGDGSVSLPVLP